MPISGAWKVLKNTVTAEKALLPLTHKYMDRQRRRLRIVFLETPKNKIQGSK